MIGCWTFSSTCHFIWWLTNSVSDPDHKNLEMIWNQVCSKTGVGVKKHFYLPLVFLLLQNKRPICFFSFHRQALNRIKVLSNLIEMVFGGILSPWVAFRCSSFLSKSKSTQVQLIVATELPKRVNVSPNCSHLGSVPAPLLHFKAHTGILNRWV